MSNTPSKPFLKWLAGAAGQGVVGWGIVKLGGYLVGLIVTYFFAVLAYDTGLSWYWLILLSGALLFFLVNVVNRILLIVEWFRQRKAKASQTETTPPLEQSTEPTSATHAAEVERLKGQISELEKALKEETEKYKSEVSQREGLKELKDSLESRWKGHVFQYNWLFAKVEAQGHSISNYVEVEKVYFCYQELETPMLKSVFGIDFRNKSIFDVTVEKTVTGYIEFEGIKFEVSPLIISHPGIVGTGNTGTITLEQRLTRPEADFIASKDPRFAEFNLSKLIITITGERFASNQPQHLEIPKRLYTDPQTEIASLKSDIAAQSKNHAEEIRRLKEEQQAVSLQLWERVRIVDRLSKVFGYAAAIEAKCQQSNMEYLKDEIDKWAGQLWEALEACFEEKDVEKFYTHIDPECPGYERGVVKVIQVPEFNAERHLWFFYHRKRLWELINEQHHGGTIVTKKEGQG